MAFSRQTLTYIAWAAAQAAVLGGVAWFADRQMALGFSDSAGWRPFTWPFSAEEAAPGRAYSGDDHDVYVWLKLGALKPSQGLARLQQGGIDAAILDVMLPEMDGFEFLEAFRKQPGCAQITVVVMTAKILTPADHLRLRGQVSQVVAKANLSPEMLAAEIRSALGKTLPNP